MTTRNDRAIDVCNRAFELVATRGEPIDDVTRLYTNTGMTIEHTLIHATHRLSIGTKAGKVLAVNWSTGGTLRVLVYLPGLWETKLKHLTQRKRY
jgi:hypothetical protein